MEKLVGGQERGCMDMMMIQGSSVSILLND